MLTDYGIKTGTYFNLDTQSKEPESANAELQEGGETEKERGLRYIVKPGLRKQSKARPTDEKHQNSLDEIIRIANDNPDSVKEFEEAYRQLPVQVNLEELGSRGYGCLHAACSNGNSSLVDYLLRKKKLDPNALSKDGHTPLMITAYEGHYVSINVLLKDKRTLIDYSNPEIGTALHCAVKANSLASVQMLLLHGAQLDI